MAKTCESGPVAQCDRDEDTTGDVDMTVRASFAAALLASVWTASGALAAEISGRVLDRDAGEALEGAVVRLEPLGVSTVTTRDGGYAFTDLPAGAYTVSVDYVGAGEISRPITISARQERILDIVVDNDAADLVTTGQRGALDAALNIRRASDRPISVVSAGGLGDVVDANVGEVVRRMPSVSVINDEGRARFAVIRGLSGDFNGVSLNGQRLTSTTGDSRRVALDVIDSNLIDRVVIQTDRTADMDADALGGVVEISTGSAFDRDEPQLRLAAEGLYDELREEWGSNIVIGGSNVFANDLLGFSGAVAVRDETLGADKIRVAEGAWSTDALLNFPEELQLVNDDLSRELTSGTFTLETRPTNAQRFFLNVFFSDAREQSFQNRLEANASSAVFDADLSSVTDAVAVLSGPVAVDRDLTDREERREIRGIHFGGTSLWRGWTLDYASGVIRSETRAPDAIDISFGLTLEDGGVGAGVADGLVALNVGDVTQPRINPAATSGDFYNAALYTFDRLALSSTTVEDDEFSFSFDARREWDRLGPEGFVQFGVKGRQREKSRERDAVVYTGVVANTPLTLSSFVPAGQDIDFQLDQIQPGVGEGAARAAFEADPDFFTEGAAETALADAAGVYDAEEDIAAGYAMAQLHVGRFKLLAGARVEDTEFDARTVQAADVAAGADASGLTGFTLQADENGRRVFTARRTSNDTYTDFLPSLHGVFQVREGLRLRFGYHRSLARPNFADVTPAGAFTIGADGSIRGALGNPDLERQLADTFDVSVELALPDGVFTAGLFTIDIDDYIAAQRFQGEAAAALLGFGDPAADLDILSAVNLNNTRISGLELSYQQSLSFLPGALDGLLVGANFTYMDGEVDLLSADGVTPGRTVDVPELSNTIYNFILGYDRGPLELRAGATYRDDYLDVIDFGGVGIDRYVSDHLQLDLSAKLAVTDGLRLFGALSNIDDEPFEAYVRADDQERLSQFDEYGFTGNLGLKYTY